VRFWDNGERQFTKANCTYVITAQIELRDGSVATGVMPKTTRVYDRYLRPDFPEFEHIARANLWARPVRISAGDRGTRLNAMVVNLQFLNIFDLPFTAATREPRSAIRARCCSQSCSALKTRSSVLLRPMRGRIHHFRLRSKSVAREGATDDPFLF
jgi:hypothetical protein